MSGLTRSEQFIPFHGTIFRRVAVKTDATRVRCKVSVFKRLINFFPDNYGNMGEERTDINSFDLVSRAEKLVRVGSPRGYAAARSAFTIIIYYQYFAARRVL